MGGMKKFAKKAGKGLKYASPMSGMLKHKYGGKGKGKLAGKILGKFG